jgi:hypothetical protein
MFMRTSTHIGIYVFWERVDVWREVYLVKRNILVRERGPGWWWFSLTGRGTRRLGDWISGTRDVAA